MDRCDFCSGTWTFESFRLGSDMYFDVKYDDEQKQIVFLYVEDGRVEIDSYLSINFCPLCGKKLSNPGFTSAELITQSCSSPVAVAR